MAEKTETETVNFEQALQELEVLVERMEQGDLSLEESLESFERGIALTRRCQTALQEAEQKVEILTGKDDSARLGPRPEIVGEFSTVLAGPAREHEGQDLRPLRDVPHSFRHAWAFHSTNRGKSARSSGNSHRPTPDHGSHGPSQPRKEVRSRPSAPASPRNHTATMQAPQKLTKERSP